MFELEPILRALKNTEARLNDRLTIIENEIKSLKNKIDELMLMESDTF